MLQIKQNKTTNKKKKKKKKWQPQRLTKPPD